MPVYEYRALNVKGKKLKGIIDAESIIAARQKLRESNIFPTDLRVTSAQEKEQSTKKRSVFSTLRRVSIREISVMTRQLATLLSGGLPLVSSLTALSSQMPNAQLKKTIAQIKEDINEGNSFARSISHFPRIFPPFYVNMVRAGEASGTLDIVLERLAEFSEKQEMLRGKIRAALAYPIFMFIIGSGVLFFLTTFVVPKITGIFEEMHQTLPGITVVLISVSSFLKSYWLILLILIVLAYIATHYIFTKTSRGQHLFDRMKLSMPLFGSVVHRIALGRFSRTLGTLLQSGVPLLTALSIVRNVVDNRQMAEVIDQAMKDVEEGDNLSGTLAKSTLFPPMMIQMISAGEQSGMLEAMLYKVADSYENDVESRVMALTSMLEPIMILVMGLFVGYIVISILLPIFEMNQLIR